MGLFNKKSEKPVEEDVATEKNTPASTVPPTPAAGSVHSNSGAAPAANVDVVGGMEVEVPKSVPMLAYIVGAVASIGGFMFGYESGQISGMYILQ